MFSMKTLKSGDKVPQIVFEEVYANYYYLYRQPGSSQAIEELLSIAINPNHVVAEAVKEKLRSFLVDGKMSKDVRTIILNSAHADIEKKEICDHTHEYQVIRLPSRL